MKLWQCFGNTTAGREAQCSKHRAAETVKRLQRTLNPKSCSHLLVGTYYQPGIFCLCSFFTAAPQAPAFTSLLLLWENQRSYQGYDPLHNPQARRLVAQRTCQCAES